MDTYKEAHNIYKEAHIKRKKQVLDLLQDTIDYLNRNKLVEDANANALTTLRQNVENNLFSIVVVGEFSAGKSTFLNALMKRWILPSFTSETTATVNYLRHTSEAPNNEAGIVYYRDGSQKELDALDLTSVEKVVSTRCEEGKEHVANSTDHVDLFLESDFLKDGVMLVDSPGLNGIAANHREMTEQEIKKSHACIFMFTADHPGSQTDFDFLRQLKSKSNNIFFVLNKINVIKESEGQTVESVTEELRESYREQFPDEVKLPKIWPIAANAALTARDLKANEYQNGDIVKTQERRDELEKLSRMKDFEERLWRYLTEGERSKNQLLSPLEKAHNILEQEKKKQEETVQILNSKSKGKELEEEKNIIIEKIDNLNTQSKKINPELKDKVSQTIQQFQEHITAQSTGITEGIRNNISLYETIEELQSYADEITLKLSRNYSSLANQLDSEFSEELLNVIREDYEDFFEKLEESFENISTEKMSGQYRNIEFSIQNIDVTFGLEKYDADCAEIRKKIENLESSTERLEEDKFRIRKNKRLLDQYNAEIKKLKEDKHLMQNTFPIPEVDRHSEETITYKKRKGLFGGIENFLWGEKVERGQKSVVDTSVRDAALNRLEQYEKDYDDEASKINAEKNSLSIDNMDSEEINNKIETERRKQEKLEEELNEKRKSFKQEIEKKNARACRRIRNEILEKAQEIETQFTIDARAMLNKQKSSCMKVVKDASNASIDNELQKAKARRDELIEMINSDEEEITKQIEFSNKSIKEAEKLLDTCIHIEATIDSELNDQIEQEEL